MSRKRNTGGEVSRLLADARTKLTPVRIKRTIPNVDVLNGFVVGLSEEWVAVAETDGAYAAEGWSIIRCSDIKSVRPSRNPEMVERLLQARGFWPPPMPDAIDLTSAETIAATAGVSFGLVMLECERHVPDAGWVGHVLSVDQKWIVLREVTPKAKWRDGSTSFKTRDVTKFDVADGYLTALGLLAGEPPA